MIRDRGSTGELDLKAEASVEVGELAAKAGIVAGKDLLLGRLRAVPIAWIFPKIVVISRENRRPLRIHHALHVIHQSLDHA
jgi:hypothetical protein